MNEAETRAELIDPALTAAGWGVVPGSRVRREFHITIGRLQGAAGKRGKPDIADYILVHNGRNLATMEAKRVDLGDTVGLGQAKKYADKLKVRFAFSTNGRGIYQVDMLTGREGRVAGWPTPEELWNLTMHGVALPPADGGTEAQADTAMASLDWVDRFGTIPFEDKSGSWQPRYYQDIAIQRVLDAIAQDKDRILLTLATGTGKTAIAFQIAWKLFHARWNLQRNGERRPRILFLADRNILADQAYNAFSSFPDDALVRIDPSNIRKKGQVPTNGSIFFTIFQTFMSGPGDTPYFGDYPADFFDFIVIDECHRGGANDQSSWRAILDYFSPAVQLGLTATPKRDVNVDTYKYFGEPVYTYSLKEGINDGFLTPFKVREYRTNTSQYVFNGEDKVLEGTVKVGDRFEESDFNVTIEIEARERFRVLQFMSDIDPREKTLVFCQNQRHAALIRDLINQEKKIPDPNYCHRVSADDGDIGEQHLRDFQDNERSIPTILTTSHKLSTGVDARNVRHVVLLRNIKNMVEFKQIIGRGTRLYDGKDYFTIHDFTRSHELFKDPAWDGEELEPESGGGSTGGGGGRTGGGHTGGGGTGPQPPPPPIIRIKLADGKERQFTATVTTSFWGPDGQPISAEAFIRYLFGEFPRFFGDEEQLRALWSMPDTRKKLLEELAEKGFPEAQLQELQKVIDAQHSDLYDVLAYVAFSTPTQERAQRAMQARAHFDQYDDKQRAFLDFVLQQYVRDGVAELQPEKLSVILQLKYKSIPDATRELGEVARIRETFVGFQKWLYG
jgi:type I restriction enzyme R subunit